MQKRDKNGDVEWQASLFQTEKGAAECHALFEVVDPALPFARQHALLMDAYDKWLEEEMRNRAYPVFRRYFLSDVANQGGEVYERERGYRGCAVSVVQQPPLNGTKIALWVYLQQADALNSCAPGMVACSHNGYRHFWSGGWCNLAATSEYQTRLLLNDYILRLSEQHCSLEANCVRTWFFVQNVDVNYAGVVKARKEVFVTQGLTEHTHYITSTGIEGRHPNPEVSVQMDAYSVYGLQPEQIRFLYAPTHLNPTYEYGVTFERGVTVTYGDRRQLYLSGTASINNRGQIVHPGDILKQTERMMENVHVLLAEGGAATTDIVQSLIYLRDTADYQRVKAYFDRHYPDLPRLIVLAPVCRPGWLIEMECIATVATVHPGFRAF